MVLAASLLAVTGALVFTSKLLNAAYRDRITALESALSNEYQRSAAHATAMSQFAATLNGMQRHCEDRINSVRRGGQPE
jgi:hypothetical protein